MQLSPHAQPDVHVRQQLEVGRGPPSLPQPTNTISNASNLTMAATISGRRARNRKARNRKMHGEILSRGEALILERLADLLEGGGNEAPGEGDVDDPVYVRELLASLLPKNDRPLESQRSLEESDLVDDVLPSARLSVGLLVLAGHDDECDAGVVLHLGQPLLDRHTGSGNAVELVDWEPHLVLDEIFHFAPNR